MTPEQFKSWLAAMKSAGKAASDRAAADALGVHPQRVAQMKRDGTAQIQTDLACAALLADIDPYPKR